VLVIQGIAFSCLFIPLTTLALSSIPRHRLADATGLNSLLRQVGGSIGLAVFATLLTRSATTARGDLMQHVSPGNPALMMTKLPLRIIDLIVRKQAMVLSFEKLFYLAGISFIVVLPLVFLLRAPKTLEKIEVHVEM
jgi:DHA2 family multidrug resistance protein